MTNGCARRMAAWMVACVMTTGVWGCGGGSGGSSGGSRAPASHASGKMSRGGVAVDECVSCGESNAAAYLSQFDDHGSEPLRVRARVLKTDRHARIVDNPFVAVKDKPLSTFSIDVDTASYALTRRYLTEGYPPPPDAVRIEEMINYFEYAYPAPTGTQPFSVSTEVSSAPWKKEHHLVRIGLQGRQVKAAATPPRNLVFLVDVSGSMTTRLGLVKRSMRALVGTLNAKDRVSIVVYAGASGVVLKPTPGDKHRAIDQALLKLQAGGPTNGGEGIKLAYRLARQHFDDKSINRVILATDGDFNLGVSSPGALERLIETERESGVFLSVLGFGRGNFQDSTLEQLADKGNGNYAYIDRFSEARKALIEQGGGTLVTIAKDVKIQVEFNPKWVKAYRLIGYENRRLAAQDFNDDKKDAGEIGAGHSVTALYEVVPIGGTTNAPSVDPLKYQKPGAATKAQASDELLTLKVRYKPPTGSKSKLLTHTVGRRIIALDRTSEAFRFASSVAAFGMLLRKSKHAGSADFAMVGRLAKAAVGQDTHGYRAEFVAMVRDAAKWVKTTEESP